jgi:chemotaxis protein MotB
MARKKKHPEHVNHERWLVSFADFMTLLMAFFVVMFAVSQVDSKKVGRFTEQFSKAVGIDMFPQPGRGLMAGTLETNLVENDNQAPPGNGKGAGAGGLPEELASIRAVFIGSKEKDEDLSKVQIIARRNELVLRLSDNLFFESGTDNLNPGARVVVMRVAEELKERKVDIRVEGHTDNRPIHTSRFRSNWDLSTARATTIVAVFAAEGMQPDRLSAAGYGEFHPIAPNDTDDGRKQNRRVDIVVTLPAAPAAPEEPAPPPTPKPEEKHEEPAKPAEHHDSHEKKHHE